MKLFKTLFAIATLLPSLAAAAAAPVEQVTPGLFRSIRTFPDKWELVRFSKDRAGRDVLSCSVRRWTGQQDEALWVRFSTNRVLTYGFSSFGTAADDVSNKVTFWFGNNRADAQTVTMNKVEDLDTMPYLAKSEPANEPGIEDALMNTRSITFVYNSGGRHTKTFSLNGSKAPLLSLFDCINR